jgi:hypothetical protein
MVQALPPNRPNHPLDIRPLLGRSWHAKHLLNPKFFDLLREIRTEDAVSIA